ncbi:MAG: FAD-dependent oxidoreductase [Chlamydiales bacterium]
MKKFLLILLVVSSFSYAEERIEEVPVVVLGGGVGALTAATYLGRAGITPVVFTGPILGGAIIQSHSVQNWPGELEISGIELIEKMQKQAVSNGAVLRSEAVLSVDFSKRPFLITTKDMFQKEPSKIRAQACIIALGAVPNLLGVPGEKTYWTRGVYNCAVCDGNFYKDRVIAIVGGGDSALSEANYLSNLAKKVYILVRHDKFKTVEEARRQEILARSNVEVLFNTSIDEIKGDGEKVTHLLIQKKGKKKEELPVDALFLAIGSTPNTALFQKQLQLDAKDYILLKKQQQTSVEGVFALGDVVDPEFKQAVTAAGDAAKAALQTQKFLANHPQIAKKDEASKNALPSQSVTLLVSHAQLDEELQKKSGPLFLYFYSTHCVPCRTFGSYYQTWAKEFIGKIRFFKVDVDKAHDLSQVYGISAIPTVLVLDNEGKVLYTGRGLNDLADLGSHLEEMKSHESIDLTHLR